MPNIFVNNVFNRNEKEKQKARIRMRLVLVDSRQWFQIKTFDPLNVMESINSLKSAQKTYKI